MNAKRFLRAIALGLVLNAGAMQQPISEQKLQSLRTEFYTALGNHRWDRAQELIQQTKQGERAITARDWQKILDQAKKTIKEEMLAQEKAHKQLEEMAHRKAKLETEKEAQKKAEAQIPTLATIPNNIKAIIIGHLTSGETLDEVGKNIRSMQINPEWARFINNEKFTQELADYLVNKFGEAKTTYVYTFIGTLAAEKLLASYIQSNKGKNIDLSDLADLILFQKTRTGVPAHAVELTARAIRAMDTNDPDFPPSFIWGVTKSAAIGKNYELYPLLAERLIGAKVVMSKERSDWEKFARVFDSLKILAKSIEENKVESLYPLLEKIKDHLKKLEPLDVSQK